MYPIALTFSFHSQPDKKLQASGFVLGKLREHIFHLGTADLLFESRDVDTVSGSGSGSTSKPPLSISQPPSHDFKVITASKSFGHVSHSVLLEPATTGVEGMIGWSPAG